MSVQGEDPGEPTDECCIAMKSISSVSSTEPEDYVCAGGTSGDSTDCVETRVSVVGGMTYLGRCCVFQPTSQTECDECMADLVGAYSIDVDLMLPLEDSRILQICESSSGEVLAGIPMRRVVSCMRSVKETMLNYIGVCVAEKEKPSGGSARPRSVSTATAYYCHVLKARDPIHVSQIIDSMDHIFWNQALDASFDVEGRLNGVPESLSSAQRPIEVAFDVRERSTDQHMVSVPRSFCGGVLELQRGVEKELIVLVLQPSSQPPLVPRRCVGVAIAAGCKVAQSAMNLLGPGELEVCGTTGDCFLVRIRWEPRRERDLQLNEVTKPGEFVCMSIAADIEFDGVKEPLRFMREINVQVCQSHDVLVRSITMSPLFDLHIVTFRAVDVPVGFSTDNDCPNSTEATTLVVSRIDLHINHRAGFSVPIPQGDCFTVRTSTATISQGSCDDVHSVGGVATTHRHPANDGAVHCSPDTVDLVPPALHRLYGGQRCNGAADSTQMSLTAAHSIDDEVLLSGAGASDKVWTEAERTNWSQIIDFIDAEEESKARMDQLKELVRKRGVPEDLRGIVWPVLCGCRGNNDNAYFQKLLDMECSDDKVICNDLHRTFTGHRYFTDTRAAGQGAMYDVSKAYANHDHEVGYCQGLSYIIATLVLHTSTECAFRVLVSIMSKYRLRSLFAVGLGGLKRCLYQLTHLIEDMIPDLHAHFVRLEINTAMFATQWFLSLYASSFGLYTVVRFFDVFLTNGLEVIFQMAIALLKLNRKSLLGLEFDGILDYFRHLPKQYLETEQVANLFDTVLSTKISQRKLNRYSKDYDFKVEVLTFEQQQIDKLQLTIERLQNNNNTLADKNAELQLESEGLVKAKIQMRVDMDLLEQRLSALGEQHRELLEERDMLQEHIHVLSMDLETQSYMTRHIDSEAHSDDDGHMEGSHARAGPHHGDIPVHLDLRFLSSLSRTVSKAGTNSRTASTS